VTIWACQPAKRRQGPTAAGKRRGPPRESTQLGLGLNGSTHEREPSQAAGHVAALHLEGCLQLACREGRDAKR